MNLKLEAKLDQGFQPMVLVFKEFEAKAKAANGEKLVIGIERNNGLISTFEMTVFPDGTGHDEENIGLVERIVKNILCQKTGAVPSGQPLKYYLFFLPNCFFAMSIRRMITGERTRFMAISKTKFAIARAKNTSIPFTSVPNPTVAPILLAYL